MMCFRKVCLLSFVVIHLVTKSCFLLKTGNRTKKSNISGSVGGDIP